MPKEFLFDLSLLQPTCPKRGIPKVVEDLMRVVVNTPELFSRARFVVERRHLGYINSTYPEIAEKILIIRSNPTSKFMFTGLFCDLRMRFDPEKYAFILMPYFNSICISPGIPQVAVIYDIIFIRFWWRLIRANISLKEWFILSYVLYKHLKIRFADKFLCISEYTKQDLESYIPGSQARAQVIPLHVKRFSTYNEPEIGLGVREASRGEFLLYVGGFDERKNTSELLEYVGSYCKDEGITLVLAGSISPREESLTNLQIARFGLQHAVRLVKNISEAELSFLFDMASIFVFYSQYEGFGLPLIEAMAKGVPVVAFDNTAITEVVENAGVLVKNKEHTQFIAKIQDIRKNSKLRTELVSRGKIRAQQFSYEAFSKTIRMKLGEFLHEWES